MPRKRAKIISIRTARKAKASVPVTPTLPKLDISIEDVKRVVPVSIPEGKETATDSLFRIIYDASCKGYCFTDETTGIPWINHNDIESKGNGLFVIRFRCPTDRLHRVYFGKLSDAVCGELQSGLNFFHSTKEENGIPYEECIWVIQEGSLTENTEENQKDDKELQDERAYAFDDVEEFPDDFKDESTADEIQERMEYAFENFM